MTISWIKCGALESAKLDWLVVVVVEEGLKEKRGGCGLNRVRELGF